ncbi:MAG: ArsR/SmtB family transcription factor, partial [Fimbriimonadaceae bacterium]
VQGLDMTRFGVMRHLRVLEDAGLVATRKKGRTKEHFLNAAPIRGIASRWVGKYAEPHLRMLDGVRIRAEQHAMTQSKAQTHIIETYIKATPDRVWEALTNPDETEKYYFGTRVQTTLEPGSRFDYLLPDGSIMLEGVVESCEPCTRLVTTFAPKWDEDAVSAGTSRVTFELEETSGITRLRLTHEGLPAGHPIVEGTFTGWSRIFAGLKSLVETGSAL